VIFNPLTLFTPIKALIDIRVVVREVPIDAVEDIGHIPAKQRLDAAGATFRWSKREKLHARGKNGWKVFRSRDWMGRPSTFTDRNGDSLLIYK